MEWFTQNLKLIRQAYDLRGLYNQHKTLILSDELLYSAVMDKANSMLGESDFDALDRSTISNFIFDLEVDKYEFDNPRPVVYIPEQEEPQITNISESCSFLDIAKVVLKPSKFVKIEVLDASCDNLHEEAQKEIFRVATTLSNTNRELAQLLGLSDRTVRMHLAKVVRENKGRSHEIIV